MGKTATKTPTEMLVELKGAPGAPALDALVERYFTMVYSTCLRITRDRHDAEDASQATFLCLARQLHQRKDIRAMGPWLYQVACNASVDICRRRKRRATHEPLGAKPEAVGMADDPACRADFAELRPAVLDQLNKLPTRYRLPLILHYFGGLSQEQLAKELACTRGTLRVRLHRGHKLLRKALEKRGICLAGGLLGAILADAVRSQVSDGLVGKTIALGHQVSNWGLQACSASPDVLAASQFAATGAGGRARFWIVISLAAASILTASAPLLAKLKDLPHWPIPLDLAPIKLPELTAPLPKLSSAEPAPAPAQADRTTMASIETPQPAPRQESQIAAPSAARPAIAAAPTPPLQRAPINLSSPAPTHSPDLSQTKPTAYILQPTAPGFIVPASVPTAPDRRDDHIAARHSSRPVPHQEHGQRHTPGPIDPPAPEPPTVIAATFSPASSNPWHNPTTGNANANLEIELATADGAKGTLLYNSLSDGHGQAIVTSMDGAVTQFTSTASVSATIGRAMLYNFADSNQGTTNAVRPLQILRNNGQVIADGRYESYNWYDLVQNDTDNPRGGFNGWFAMNGGRLLLPAIPIRQGTHSYNWGEDASDATPDLINSLRLTATASADSSLSITLVATDAWYLPQFPAGHHFISTYELFGDQAITGPMSTLIRYDDARLTYLGLDENQVKLWYYTDPATGWQRAYDGFGRDIENNWVWADIPADTHYIAISTPEPASLALLATGAFLLLRRRKA